jgi:5'-nucleotidase (lipoprotein e(P4) family)
MAQGLGLAAPILLVGICAAGCAPPAQSRDSASNPLTMAVAWKQSAAEYEALYYQGFNIARMHVDRALEARRGPGADPDARPLAVIADVDDTVLDTRDYWRSLLTDGVELFDDARWDLWVSNGSAPATPGAVAFLTYCRDQNVEVFYVTNRDQGPRTLELAVAQLERAGLPYADETHVTVLTESSNKEPRQAQLAEDRDIVVFLGDNLNDFRRVYYVTDAGERRRLMTDDRDAFGRRFVLFPNATDGHWLRAIFGESEPPPTADNLATLLQVAAGR